MFHRAAVLLAVLTVALPAAAEYRTASELVDAMLEAQRTRAEGVSDYAMDVTLVDAESTQYFERTQVAAPGGRSLETFRLVPPDELQRRLQGEPGVSAADIQSYVDRFAGVGGAALGTGVPPGLAKALRSGAPGTGPGAGAWGVRDLAAMSTFVERAEIVGREPIDGRDAYLVRADGLELTQASDGAEFVMRSIALWVDAEDLVARKMHIDGVVTQEGESREMFIEKLDREQRRVPGSRMILPYRSIMRMGGMLGPKEQQELEQARAQLAELDRQMASMPADQKAMMQSMMGSKIDMMRKMADGGAFEVETIVREIRVNQGISGVLAHAPAAAPGGLALPAMNAGSGSGAQRPARPQQDAEALEQARDACLQQKVAEAQAAGKKKKRFGKFLGAMGRIAGRHAGNGMAADVSRVSSEIYDAQATTEDLQAAAEALGITQDDIAACENPE